MKPVRFSRRTVLRGAGMGLALPALEAMMDGRERLFLPRAEAAAPSGAPIRFLGFLLQNGPPKQWWSPVAPGQPLMPPAGAANVLTDFGGSVRYWDPAKVGEQHELNEANKPLEPFKADFNIVTGLHQKCLASVFHHSDGAVACFTGHPMNKKPEVGSAPSLDWILGQSVGKGLVHPALYMGLRRDADQSTNRWYKSSWIANMQPAKCIDRPRDLADKFVPRMPGTEAMDPVAAAEARRGRSILDFVRADAQAMQAKLGASDRARLEQHIASVREIERALEASAKVGASCSGAAPATPEGYLPDEEQMPLMAKIIAFGFACDLFRYGIFHVQMLYPKAGGRQDDHDQSHFVTSKENIYYWSGKMKFYAALMDALKKTPEGSKNLLYNSVLTTGVDVAVGAKHNFDDLPIVLAGNAGGQIRTGRHLHYANTTYNNLYASILSFCGLPTAKFGRDGTGTLAGLGG